MAYDAENFFDDMLALFRANLNAKLAALNTEKGDSWPTNGVKDDFTDGDYIINFNEAVINKDEFIYYGFVDVDAPQSTPIGTVEAFKMFFSIMIISSDDETLETKKILRYTRALEEVARESSLSYRVSPLEIETFKPITIADNNDSDWYRAGGIHVTGVIG